VPHIKAITEGKVAAKQAYDVIERHPNISPNSGKDFEVKGMIEFRDVNFYYPTRTDHMVLKNFSCTFQKGKTTAIVGPSGSGKSTIVQLLERFYDPVAGSLIIDGEPLTGLNLQNFRK